MVFIIIPDDYTFDMRLIFRRFSYYLTQDFKNINKVKFNRLILTENEEDNSFRIDRHILTFDSKNNKFIPRTNKVYYSKGKYLEEILNKILIEMEFDDSVCFINNSVYTRIFNLLQDRLDFIEIEHENHKLYYLKSSIGEPKEDKYGIHSLLKYKQQSNS